MKTKQYEFLKENEVESHHYRYDGHSVKNIKIILLLAAKI